MFCPFKNEYNYDALYEAAFSFPRELDGIRRHFHIIYYLYSVITETEYRSL